MDLLTRDSMILITVEAARKAGMSPDSYLNRYFGEEGGERNAAEHFLFTMEIVYTSYEKLPVWDARWSLDNSSVKTLKWMDDE